MPISIHTPSPPPPSLSRSERELTCINTYRPKYLFISKLHLFIFTTPSMKRSNNALRLSVVVNPSLVGKDEDVDKPD